MDEIQSIGSEIDLFTTHTDCIGNILINLVTVIQEVSKKSRESLIKFEDEKCEIVKSEKTRMVRVPGEYCMRWDRLSKRYRHAEQARNLLPRTLLVSLVSQYDAFLGRIFRVVFLRMPEILNGSDRKLSFEEITQFESIENAREYIIEKEIEAVLRSSHMEQFRWMEKAFNLSLTKGLKSWPTFVELTERRNLFVHTDGIVSSQYLAVCRQNKCDVEDEIREGTRLAVSQKYFVAAYECVYEIGVKLGHVLWRKLFPAELDKSDSALSKTTYELIDSGKYRLASHLLNFACTDFKKFANESNQLVFIVNRAQAYKWLGDEEGCARVMRDIDWSAKGDEFKLAAAVLASDWEQASKIMKRIGSEGPVHQHDYREWPLFKEWRKQDRFLAAYEEIFNEPFNIKAETKQSAIASIQGDAAAHTCGEDGTEPALQIKRPTAS